MPMLRAKKRRQGFTLLEVLLVMAIILILVSISYTSIQAYLDDAEVQSAGEQIRADFANARALAIDNSTPMRFAVQVGTNRYRIAPDDPEEWNNVPEMNTERGFGSAQRSFQNQVPETILIEAVDRTPDSGGVWIPVCVFKPDGSANSDATLRLRHRDEPNSPPLLVILRELTGFANLRYADESAESLP